MYMFRDKRVKDNRDDKPIMIIIRIFSSYCGSDIWKQFEKNHDLTSDPEYNMRYKFTEGDDYTHVILLNTAAIDHNLPIENVIGLAHEPPSILGLNLDFVYYVNKRVSNYYIGCYRGLPSQFKCDHAYILHAPLPKEIPTRKTKLMSIMVSNKDYMPGHAYRISLLEMILRSNFPIDVYGRGAENLIKQGHTDPRLKGSFESSEEMFRDYMFTIAVENTVYPAYFSEKVIDPLLNLCTPLYYGCTRIDQYLPNMTVPLNGHPGVDFHLIKEVLENPGKFYKNINPHDVMKRTSISNVIHKHFLKNEDDLGKLENEMISDPAPVAEEA